MSIKAIYHVGPKSSDLSKLTKGFPTIAFNLSRTYAELIDALGSAEILIMNGVEFNADISAAVHKSPTLKWMQFTSSGVENVIRNGGYPEHVIATNVAGLRAGNLSEHAFAMLLFLTRQLRTLESARGETSWIKREIFPHMASLSGRTMLVVGLGAIGQATAKKASCFGMRVIGISRGYKPDALIEQVWPRHEADEAFRQADVVVVAAPLEDGTVGYIDRRKLALLKPSAILINVSRGEVVDEQALIEACRERRIAGAGLDVMSIEPLPVESPLWSLDNVIITPHVGGAGSDQLGQLLEKVAVNIRHYLAGEPLENVVSG